MLFIRLLLFSILIFNAVDETPQDKSIFISPVKIPLALSANFGELRIDHFHSGVDIKTQGVTGQEVVAAANGYIYRISISPGGFGKAVYLRHPSGYTTVYGHLERFTPEIDEYVKKSQYEKKNYTITLFPQADRFPVNQGDVIAYSGNTGGSSGPHLHYEIRKSDSEEPVNPLLFKFGTADNIAPVLERLVIYPGGYNTSINGKNSILKLPVSGGDGKYYLSAGNEISINGPGGFGIKSYDVLNDSYNKCAVYSIELRIDSVTRFRYVMDKFAFSESRYINSHIDYEAYLRENTYYERAFVLPNDRLTTYRDVINRGIFNFCDSGKHHIEIILSDTYDNKSTLEFNVISNKPSVSPVRHLEAGVIPMPYNRTNRFRAENITITIPSGALYDTLFFSYRKDSATPQMYSDVHYVHNKFTPLQRAYSLSIKPKLIPEGKASKMLIVQLSDDFNKTSIGGTVTEGYITADALSFGMFYVGIDTVAPGIFANSLTAGADLTGKSQLRIRITDDLSGIKSYEPIIDGKWARLKPQINPG
ncbi:MAG: M23 family metallopeptidase [Bacteroidia bacterium]|nr:M23 family metallopeptidase [Bacteroidia bacterium]